MKNELNKQQQKALRVLNAGGIIAYPTDTTYGLGCLACDDDAVKKVFQLKGRNFDKPLSIACSSLQMVQKYAKTMDIDEDFLSEIFPGPVTLLLEKSILVSDTVTAGSNLVGVRIPDQLEILELISQLGRPITTTSANLSGQPDPVNSSEVKLEVDFIFDGECRYKISSTIIDPVQKKIIRAGANIEYYQMMIDKYL